MATLIVLLLITCLLVINNKTAIKVALDIGLLL